MSALVGPPVAGALPASIVELEMGNGLACLAEFRWVGERAAAVVLVHDNGRDLDSMRSLAQALWDEGFMIVNLDLPGHGLSGGDYERDSARAIAAAALFADPHGIRGVSFVAAGQSCQHLLRAPLADATSVVLVDPHPLPSSLDEKSIWRTTPSLFVVDPANAESDRAAGALSEEVMAWNIRCFVHRGQPRQDEDRDVADHDRYLHIRALSTKFLLEQRFYRESRQAKLKDRA